MSLLRLKLEDLNTRNLQTRAALNEDTVADYAEAMERGDKFPAVTVFTDGAEYYLADGFHRVEALRRIGKKVVVAELQDGDFKAALLYALKANSTHGLRRTNADKRHALEMAWNAREELFGGEPSQNLLADTCGISRQTVVRFLESHLVTMLQGDKAEQGVNRLHPVKSENAQNGEEAPKTRSLPIRPQMAGKQPPQRPKTPSVPVRSAAPSAANPAPVRRVGRDGKSYAVPVRPAAPQRPKAYDHAAGVATDRFGVEVPMDLREAFKAETVRDEIEMHLRTAATLLKRAMDAKDPSVAQFRQADLIDLQNAVRTAKFTKPYCVCRICQGNGRGSCSACHETGFQTQAQYENNPKEFKA